MPVIELTTTGRRSGQPRATMLTSPYQDGSTMVIVASRGGDDHHPAWYLNLRDNPEVTMSMDGKPAQRMRAEIASPEDRERLWPLITADHRNYAGYQLKTKREIPVVLLRSVDD
jgi:deazaflavin-dependent oxidoreductase (nitroreductase family)